MELDGKPKMVGRVKKTGSALEDTFLTRWRQLAPPGVPAPVLQYRFAPPRRWPADFAWPEARVLVEIEGGTYSGGKHVRGQGYRNDCEKYNAATVMGWRVLRYTTDMLRDDPAGVIAQVAEMVLGLKGRRNE